MTLKPSFLPTSIGSLPHKDPYEACELVLKYCKEIPAWPQLPTLGFKERMHSQIGYDLPGAIVDEEQETVTIDPAIAEAQAEEFYQRVVEERVEQFAIEEECAKGLWTMLSILQKRDHPMILKGQIIGPITLGLQITDLDGQSIIYSDLLFDIVLKTVRMKAKWQESVLSKVSGSPMLFFDEPYLTMFGSAFLPLDRTDAMRYLDEVRSGIEGYAGIHCCGNTDWSLILGSQFDIVSFDAYNYLHYFCLYPEEIEEYLRRGGSIAWGIVPSRDEELRNESFETLVSRLSEGISLLVEKGIDKTMIMESSLVTPRCGLGGMSERESKLALALTRKLSDHFRAESGLGE